MRPSLAIGLYQKYFVDLQFERARLFKAVHHHFGGSTVLYPGCFVHITPSLYYPHVVYVDWMPEAAQFFNAREEILGYIDRKKSYRRSAFIQFIEQDFRQPLPLPENSFDLLLALYVGGVSLACKKYLKPGGLVLSNNHHDDAGQAAADPELVLVAAIHQKGETWVIHDNHLTDYFIQKRPVGTGERYLQSSARQLDYTRNADAYLFQKSPARSNQ